MLTISQPLIFVDTETTHLDLAIARPWEIAMIRRDTDGTERLLHLMIGNVRLADADPEALAVGRFDERHGPGEQPGGHAWVQEPLAAEMVADFTAPGPDGVPVALVGSNPSYDAQVLVAMLRRHGREPAWDHHTHDLVTWTLATLAGSIVDHSPMPERSYALSEAVGAEPPGPGVRHTARGDAEWVRSWWDQLMTGVLA